jgi:superfamily II DNA or RNA helicase
LNIFLFNEMLRDVENIYDAATMATNPFGSRESEIVPERPRQVPRECQRRALEKLKAAREESMLKSVSIVCATGIGKSLIACMDAISVLYDDETGDPLTKIDRIGMVWCSPGILLVEQSAESFSAWEESELR